MDCTRQFFVDTIKNNIPNAVFHSEVGATSFFIYVFNYAVDWAQFQALGSEYNKFCAACYVWEYIYPTTQGFTNIPDAQSMGSIIKDRTALFQGPRSIP